VSSSSKLDAYSKVVQTFRFAHATELAPGTVVAGYRIEALLGRGAIAEVYRAYDENLEQRRRPEAARPPECFGRRFRQRFERESTIAAGLEHPNVVPVLATGEDDGHLYLAMELIPLRSAATAPGERPTRTGAGTCPDRAGRRRPRHRNTAPASSIAT